MSAADPLSVTAQVALAPRSSEAMAALVRDPGTLQSWVAQAFNATCRVEQPPRMVEGRVHVAVTLAAGGAPPLDVQLLRAAPGDQRLWKAWVEQSCTAAWCDVKADVVVHLSDPTVR